MGPGDDVVAEHLGGQQVPVHLALGGEWGRVQETLVPGHAWCGLMQQMANE